jgi:hypothetical protein
MSYASLVLDDLGKAQTVTVRRAVRRVTSLPACWDTLRAGTNEGYFDFQHIAFFAHIESGYKSVLAIILGLLADTTCPFYLEITLLLPPPCKSYKQSSFRV